MGDSKQTELNKISEELESTRTEKEAKDEENQRLSQMLNESEIHAQLLEANKSIENITIENLKLKEHNEKLENDNDLMKTGNTEIKTKLDENENKIREDSEIILDLTTSKVGLEENIKTLNSDKLELENKLELLNTKMLYNRNEFES